MAWICHQQERPQTPLRLFPKPKIENPSIKEGKSWWCLPHRTKPKKLLNNEENNERRLHTLYSSSSNCSSCATPAMTSFVMKNGGCSTEYFLETTRQTQKGEVNENESRMVGGGCRGLPVSNDVLRFRRALDEIFPSNTALFGMLDTLLAVDASSMTDKSVQALRYL